jgi:hypothetical protein
MIANIEQKYGRWRDPKTDVLPEEEKSVWILNERGMLASFAIMETLLAIGYLVA